MALCINCFKNGKLQFSSNSLKILHFASKAFYSSKTTTEYEVVVAGGGSGGIAVAARLKNALSNGKIAIIDRAKNHYYQPMWTLIGAGEKPLSACRKPMIDVIPSNVDYMHGKIAEIDPENNNILLKDGSQIRYKYLVCALGIRIRFDLIKGLPEAFDTPGVCSNFTVHTVTKTLPAMQNFESGNAIFTFPPPPFKCAGASQQIMYLAEDYFRKHEKRKQATVMFNTSDSNLFSVEKYADSLKKIIDDRDIKVNYGLNLIEVDTKSKEAIFERLGSSSSKKVSYSYDMLHISPPMTPHECLKSSSLVDDSGFVDVDKQTTQHVKYPNVFALGDCSNIPTSKTVAAVGNQHVVLVENLLRVRSGKDCLSRYDGYTSCPLTTGYKSCIFAEFDFDNQPLETFPVDQSKERRSMYYVKSELMPNLYWNKMVKGRWAGTKPYRRLFRFGFS